MERDFGYFDITGIRFSNFTITDSEVDLLKAGWQSFVQNEVPGYPEHFSGRGIVICGGGIKYFTCSWININLLRHNGCTLPIELWYRPGELNGEIVEKLRELDVVCKDVQNYTSLPTSGYTMKPFAIINSSFKEVLFLDADNNSLTDPTYLFEDEAYQETGTLFWPDFWLTDKENPIWRIVESTDYNEYEQESGQLLVNKERCWNELNLSLYFNRKKEVYYRLLLGDKDTFKFAWKALKTPYTMIPHPVGFCGYMPVVNKVFCRGIAMVQHDRDGRVIFIHQNLAKWDIIKENERLWNKIRRFTENAQQRAYIQEMIALTKERTTAAFDIEGDIYEVPCDELIQSKEAFCLQKLAELRNSGFYHRFILDLYISRSRGEVLQY